MQYSRLQREHNDLLQAKDYLDKQAAKNMAKIAPPSDTAADAEKLKQFQEEKRRLEASNTQYLRQVADMTNQLRGSDEQVVRLSQQLQQLKVQIVSAGDVSVATKRISELRRRSCGKGGSETASDEEYRRSQQLFETICSGYDFSSKSESTQCKGRLGPMGWQQQPLGAHRCAVAGDQERSRCADDLPTHERI